MLSPSRKADRVEMVRQLTALAAECGAAVTLTAEGSNPYYKRGFAITLHGEYGLNADLGVDATSWNARDDCYVIAWHMDSKTTAKLSYAFEAAIGQVNMYHRHKATTVVRSFDTVLISLRVGLTMARDRTAFMQ